MPKTIDQKGIAGQTDTVRRIYERYGAMLLGYLAQTLNDRRLAEECLTIIFTELAIDDVAGPDYNWLQLRNFAQTQLAELSVYRSANNILPLPDSQGIWGEMTEEEKCVFYNAYHCGKPIAVIAEQLGKSQAEVRKVLAGAFSTIRRS